MGANLNITATVNDFKARHDMKAYKSYNDMNNNENLDHTSRHLHVGTPHVSLSLESKRSIRNFKEHGLSSTSYGVQKKRAAGTSSIDHAYLTTTEAKNIKGTPLEIQIAATKGHTVAIDHYHQLQQGGPIDPQTLHTGPGKGHPALPHDGSPVDQSGLRMLDTMNHLHKQETREVFNI